MGKKSILTVASTLVTVLSLSALTSLPLSEAGAQVFSPDRVAVLRCVTNPSGTITVRNSSVTSAVGASVQEGDRCAAAISALQRAGMRMLASPKVTSNPLDNEVSFGFVFIAGCRDGAYYYDDDYDDDDYDDDYDDYDDDDYYDDYDCD